MTITFRVAWAIGSLVEKVMRAMAENVLPTAHR